MPATADWSTRPVPSALSPERLAGLIERSVERSDTMLFTVTPRESLGAIGDWQRLGDLAFAGQMREIVAAYNAAGSKAREFAADEIGLAIGATTTTGGHVLAQALGLAGLPGVLEAVEGGLLTARHALAVLRELDKVELTVEQRRAVALLALARYRGQAPGELAGVVRRLILTVDRAAAAARDATATKARQVWFSADVDGQAVVTARGPAAKIAAIRAALEQNLPDADPDDDRSREAREFDLLVALLTGGAEMGSWHAEVIVPFSVADGGDLELAEIPGLGPILPSTARDLLDQADTVAQTAVNQDGHVIAAGDPIRVPRQAPADETEPQKAEAEVAEPAVAEAAVDEAAVDEPAVTTPAPVPAAVSAAGSALFGPAPSPRLRLRPELLDRLATPPDLKNLTSCAYRFPPRLERFLHARDRTCVFPGCGRPARRTDNDHRIPWPVGPTSADNGQCLCRHHHRAKHTVFTVLRDPDGTLIWITRGGWRFRRRPKGF